MVAASFPVGRSEEAKGPVRNPVSLTNAEQFSLAIDFRQSADDDMPFELLPLPVELQAAVPLRRMHFLAGRHCAAQALRRLRPDQPDFVVGRTERGVPVWPSGVVGSITHTHGFVSAAVAHADAVRALGIDSEGIMSSEQARDVATHVSWPSELAQAREAGLDRPASLTLVFSAKEATFKCLYPLIGELFYYHDVRIVGVDPVAHTFRARLVKTLSPLFPADTFVDGLFALTDSHVHTGLVLAAC